MWCNLGAIYVLWNVYAHIHFPWNVDAHIGAYMHAYMSHDSWCFLYVSYMHMYVYVYVNTHTHTHTHTHTQEPSLFFLPVEVAMNYAVPVYMYVYGRIEKDIQMITCI